MRERRGWKEFQDTAGVRRNIVGAIGHGEGMSVREDCKERRENESKQ